MAQILVDNNDYLDPLKNVLPRGFQFDAGRDYLLPIPPSEISLNKELTQNRGGAKIEKHQLKFIDNYKEKNMKNIFYKLFSISLLGVCLMGCEDETKYLPLPQAVPFTMTVNNTTFVMGEKLVVDLDINPDKDGSEVLANEDFDIYFTAKTGTEDVSGVFKDFHNIVTFPKGEKSIRVEFPLKETGLEGSKNFNFVAFSRGYEIGNPSFPMKVSDYYRVNMAIQGNADNIVTEGDKFVLVASLDKPRAIPIVVSISAKAEDESSFENLSSELTIPAGALNAKTDPISLVMDGAKTGDKELTLNFTSNSEANPMKSDKLVIMMTDLESLANPDMYDPTLVYEHPEYPFVSKGNKSKFDAWWGVTEARL